MNSSFERLHPVMRDPEHPESYLIAYALLTWFDEQLLSAQSNAKDFYWNHLFHQSAQANSLDWTARLCGYDGEFWDANWPESVKRDLIRDFRLLWAYRGKPQIFQRLLDMFRLDAVIKTNDGWILGGTRMDDRYDPPQPAKDPEGNLLPDVTGSVFPIRFGGEPLQFRLIVPARYTESTPEFKLLMRLRKLWLCNALDVQVIRNFDNDIVNPFLLLPE